MKKYSDQIREQQHKNAQQIKLKEGDIVMAKLHIPIANSNKLSPKYTGPYKVLSAASGNKFQLKHLKNGDVVIRHFNDLKMASGLNSNTNSTNNGNEIFKNSPGSLVDRDNDVQGTDNENSANEQDDNVNEYRKKLRSHVRNVNTVNERVEGHRNLLNETVWKIAHTEDKPELENLTIEFERQFYMYVDEILSELGVVCNSFYR